MTSVALANQIQFYIGVDRLLSVAFPIWPTMCDTLSMVQPEIKEETLITSNIYNLLTIACYITIWILMAIRKEQSSINKHIDSYVIVPALLLYVVSAGSNLPVLFAFSADYNKAFKNTFKHLFCGKPVQQTIVASSSNRNARIGIMRERNNNRGNLSQIVEPIRHFA
uniref:Serpentine receptor class gamma n=1 Tax=Meloidogyne floridensis TaxID=298350 RepID=A0A915NMX2_9BILA